MKKRLALIYGGRSTEHEISISTLLNFTKWIDYKEYTIIPIYINIQGEWKISKSFSNELNILDIEKLKNIEGCKLKEIVENYLAYFDVAVPLIHGVNGEDGTIQGLFELLNIPYTGNRIFTSSLAIDKIKTKNFFKQSHYVNQVPFIDISLFEWENREENIILKLEEDLSYPVIVKPSKLGSSIGISIANSRKELIKSIDDAFEYDYEILVEKLISAREINVSIIGNSVDCITSYPAEINFEGRIYDYEQKYKQKKEDLYKLRALSNDLTKEIRSLSKNIYNHIGGIGPMRLDFFISKDDKIFLNEINTLPSMGSESIYQQLLNDVGVTNKEIVEIMIESAINLNSKRKNNNVLIRR